MRGQCIQSIVRGQCIQSRVRGQCIHVWKLADKFINSDFPNIFLIPVTNTKLIKGQKSQTLFEFQMPGITSLFEGRLGNQQQYTHL